MNTLLSEHSTTVTKRTKHTIRWGIAFVIVAVVAFPIYVHSNREQKFLDSAFRQLNGGQGNAPVRTVKLESGDTMAVILEHACCSGAGFDAVAIRTSGGEEFFAQKNYCGIEGFYQELVPTALIDLTSLRTFLVSQGYQQKVK